MIGKSLWKNLKDLVDVDTKIKKIESETKRTEKIIQDDKDNIPKLNLEAQKLSGDLLQVKKNVHRKELVAKDLSDKETKERKLLEETSNYKEYKAAEKELLNITQQRMASDDALIEAWHNLEEIEKKLKKCKEEVEIKIVQLKEGLEVQEKNLLDLISQKNEVAKTREVAAKNLPAEWLAKYERMQNRVDDPIVPVLNSCCSACYYPILIQDMYKLKKSGVLPCRECYRFLYYDEEEETETKQEKF